jgi:hypothetical protein
VVRLSLSRFTTDTEVEEAARLIAASVCAMRAAADTPVAAWV